MYSSISLLAVLAASASAATITINAGQNGFTYSPNSVTAAVGDTVEFHFFGSIHTAVQGPFNAPCSMGDLSSTGFDSGATANGDVFAITITDTNPIWFYCATPTHCQGGMVGAINAPSTGNTLAAYQAAAAGTSSSSSAGKLQGGVLNPQSGSSSSSSSSSSASASASSSASSSAQSSTSSAASSSSSSASNSTASVSSFGNSTMTSAASTASSSAGPSSVKASTTSSGATSSPSSVTTSSAGSLMEMTARVVLLSAVFGLGAVVVLMH